MNNLDRIEQLTKLIRVYSNETFNLKQKNRLKVEEATELLRQVAASLVNKEEEE